MALSDWLAGCSPDLSPEMRKMVDPVCFGKGCVRDGVEDDEADPSSSATGSFSSPGAVEKPPE